MISLQTNVNSLVAQQNLNVNSAFQSKTIAQLTSGYRINSSGDDAAGLAVANQFRSTVAELTQGVANGNDGVAQLQIMDGGMSNISQILDRLKTLATQSASGAFTGDRTALNNEYQTDVGEIDRQAQSIGLSTGGHFAQSLGVYIGGGATTSGAASTANGTVSVDLSGSVVDSKALGLRTSEFTVQSATGTNLGAASNTSVSQIVAANTSDNGMATFELSGSGYSSTGSSTNAPISVSVQLSSSDTTTSVAAKLNAAIQAAGNAGTNGASALRTANIQASMVTDGSGNQQLQFTSAGSAFQVQAGNNTANALLGNFAANATNAAQGASVAQTVMGTTAVPVGGAGALSANGDEFVKLNVTVNGQQFGVTVHLASTDANRTAVLGKVTAAGNGYAAIQAAGVTASIDSTTNELKFVGSGNQSITVQAAGDTANILGLGGMQEGSQLVGNGQILTGIGSGGISALTVHVGSTDVDLAAGLTINTWDNQAAILADIKNATNYGQLAALGVSATIKNGQLAFVGSSGQAISITALTDGGNVLGFGNSLGTLAANSKNFAEAVSPASTIAAGGNSLTGNAGVLNGTTTAETDTLVLAVTDQNGAPHAVTLNIAVGANAGTAAILSDVTTGGSDPNYATLAGYGIKAVMNGTTLTFVGNNGQTIGLTSVTATTNNLGFGTGVGTAGTATQNSVNKVTSTLNAGTTGDTATLAFSVNGGQKILVNVTSTDGTTATMLGNLQAAISANAELNAAGIKVDTDGSVTGTIGAIYAKNAATTGITFRASAVSNTGSGNMNLGLGVDASGAPATYLTTDQAGMVASQGASETGLGTGNDVFSFAGLANKGGTGGVTGSGADQQVLSFSAKDANGNLQSYSVTLNATNAYDVDKAVQTINTALQQTANNATLKNIMAVKETNAAGTAEGIRFVSSLNNFSVGVGEATNYTAQTPVGMYDGTAGATTVQGMTVNSSASGAIDISTQAGAEQAVIAVGAAVAKLGTAQAAVGKGQNQLTYAISLANSQITNFSTAESNIRDANVAQQAANLTKAQVLQQASIAAMAQANSAPQAVLALLRG